MNIDEAFEYQKQTCSITISHLFDKYKNEDYMLNKLNNYILIQLPKLMENYKISKDEKLNNKTKTENEKQLFQNKFLNNNLYFYISQTNIFIYYDGINYIIYNEDDICHKIFTLITLERKLMSYKEKTKNTIIKKIKSSSLFKTIPESKTIQNTINLFYPTLFNNKDKVKYFLTIIGDNFLKSQGNLVHLISNKAKKFLNEITHYSYLYTNLNPVNTFKFKYHDQDYNNIRLLDINLTVEESQNWHFIKQNIFNIISVSCYYSNRFNNSDNFIENHCDYTLSNYSFFLKNNDSKSIIKMFTSYYIETCPEQSDNKLENSNYNIPWKHMVYLWKLFLEEKKFPNIIFNNSLKILLSEKFTYSEDNDCFLGITSKYLPKIAAFIDFWDNQMLISEEEELEISEINVLFKQWSNSVLNNKSVSNYSNDQEILNIIKFFFQEIEICDDKYIMNLSCKLWDKNNDITIFLINYKENYDAYSLNEAYQLYVKSKPTFVSSKRYFTDKYNLIISS